MQIQDKADLRGQDEFLGFLTVENSGQFRRAGQNYGSRRHAGRAAHR